MTVTRNNHFVPEWYQKQFFEDGRKTLFYLDLSPPIHRGKNGIKEGRFLFQAPPSRAFVARDLYSTFFGTKVSDEIERKLFGDIDGRGADAVRAFSQLDKEAWNRNFEAFFEYLDAQKLRTPKGLSWLKRQYPELSQNDLMIEMQSIRFMNCNIWTTGVREIVSASKSSVKFIVTDNPVTVYNHAIDCADRNSARSEDPEISKKASQTIFPLGPDHCLILSNLEYARDPLSNPLEDRTFARNFRPTMVSTIDFINSRQFDEREVSEINFILKSRAQRHIAAGREAWLYPERLVTKPWAELRQTLRPPEDELYRFGGEMIAQFDSGHVHFQDEFGRSEKPRTFLQKQPAASPLKPKDPCGCGSGAPFSRCCAPKPVELRPSWAEESVRERNLMLYRGLSNLFGFDGKDWTQIRREMTDEKIAKAYGLYAALWPLETDLLGLLPKPDGKFRSVYTGSLHPKRIHEFATGSSLYFGEILIQHPFVHPEVLNKDFRPTEHPRKYRAEFLRTLIFFMGVMPLVDAGLVNLIPDPCDFDFHLRDQMMAMARARTSAMGLDASLDLRLEELQREDFKRDLLGMPVEIFQRKMSELFPGGGTVDINELKSLVGALREADPLAVLQDGSLDRESEGQFHLMRLAPNFEITMFLAQATGAQILTDSPHRWLELTAACNRRYLGTSAALQALAGAIGAAPLAFPPEWQDILAFSEMAEFVEFRSVFSRAFNYVKHLKEATGKPNFEAQLAARYSRSQIATQRIIRKSKVAHFIGHAKSIVRIGGIQDNAVNRLLLMSSSKHHLQYVPMATFLSPPKRSA